MRTTRVLATTAFLMFVATATANAQAASDAMGRVDEFVWSAGQMVRGKSLRQLESIAPLRSHTVAPFAAPNAPPGESWEIHSFTYESLYVEGVIGPEQQFLLAKMVVTGPLFRLPHGLAIGSSRRDVESVLGAASQPGSPTMTYEGETEKVVFHVSNGRVSKVEFLFYVD